jgi:hypothetical protein
VYDASLFLESKVETFRYLSRGLEQYVVKVDREMSLLYLPCAFSLEEVNVG